MKGTEPMDVPTLIREIKALSPEDRARVIDAVREPDMLDELFTPEQIAELDRRLDTDDAGTLAAEPWDVVKARWQAKT